MSNKEKWQEVKPGIWNFREDKILIGVLEEARSDVGPNKSMLYTFRKEDGTLISCWGSTVLDARLAFVKVGEKVKIEYTGEGEAKPGRNPTHLFKVFHTEAKHKKNLLEKEEKKKE